MPWWRCWNTPTVRERVSIGVLGAGLQGAGVALELASRGIRTDLYDREPHPMMRASVWNEGKVHLGFVYAKDAPDRTAALMLSGAFEFWPRLGRWIDLDASLLSDPFFYAVRPDSMLSAEEVETHFEHVAERFLKERANTGWDYLGVRHDHVFRRVGPERARRLFPGATGVFETAERSVDTHEVARRIRAAIRQSEPVSFITSRVDRVDRNVDGSFTVHHTAGSSRYDQVVNALWSDRLRIDRQLGIGHDRQWLHREKVAIHLPAGTASRALPSVTFVLGAYGDVVRFRSGRAYLSWYPACLVGSSSEVVPPLWSLSDEQKRTILERSISTLSDLVPAVTGLDVSEARLEGGAVFGWGKTDITDPASELHERFDIGVHSYDGYHSIDTGKYTTAPKFAVEAAERVVGA